MLTNIKRSKSRTRKVRRSRPRRSKVKRSRRSKVKRSRRSKTRLIRKNYKTNKTSDCRMNIILDIDETLGHNISKKLWNQIPIQDKKKYNYLEYGKNIFLIRPHIKKFTKFLFDNFNVNIWTLGSRGYAQWVAHNILIDGHKNRHVKLAMWSTHDYFASGISEEGYGKDLKYLWIDTEYDSNIDPNNEEDEEYYDKYEDQRDHPIMLHNFYPCNTILIDDNKNNTTNARNNMNAIHIEPFGPFGHRKNESYQPHYNDRVLLNLIPVLEKVKKQMDKNTCSDKYFATCMYPSEGREGSVFNSDMFREYYQTHGSGLSHVHIGN